MAVVQNPIIGRARNKMGGVIFQTWKGKNVLRSKPLTVANPKTQGQMAQRNKLSEAVKIYRETSGAVQLGYVQQAVGMSQYNAFVSEVMKNAMTVVGSVVTVHYDDILFSKGTISIAAGFNVAEGLNPDLASVSWVSDPLAPGQSLSDTLVGVTYNETQDIWTSIITLDDRSQESAQLDLEGTNVQNDVIHVWAFFVNANGNKTSDSQYGTYTIA